MHPLKLPDWYEQRSHRRFLPSQFFGPSLVDTIMQIPTYPAVVRDRLELNFQYSGKTIASMAYAACFPSPSADFSWLSRLGLRPRERLFWWRLAQDAIPTRYLLLRRGLTDSGVCPWGCPSPENRDHTMRGCSNVAAISRELHRWGIDMPAVQDWASFPALVSSTRKLNLGPLRVFCHVVYQHWRARNTKVHGREFGTPLILAATIMENINCSTDFPSTRYWGTNRPDRPSPSIFWCPPPPDWIKINVDGAVFPNNCAGIGVVVRNHRGAVQLAAGSGFPH
ncbi:hypothetical protein KSP39_PZI024146 [Platanthera zijinensis]|uniref:Reverse transcriptase zinc-binding domain-containing protein n=1 Tax=Platanthera zijinensis TaxID=2320716 RepID=A0AAP0AU94_9ASPA